VYSSKNLERGPAWGGQVFYLVSFGISFCLALLWDLTDDSVKLVRNAVLNSVDSGCLFALL
jgi:hypothetical protein